MKSFTLRSILNICLISLLFILSSTETFSQSWYSNSWSYRKSHLITGSAGAGTNYQIRIIAHKATGTDAGADVYMGTNVLNDFADVRFTASDGTTLLDYWLETGSLTSGTQATFWVEVSADLGSNQTIYIYYGNSSATTISNGVNTFTLFDDFTGTSLEGTKWRKRNGGTPSFAGGLMTIAANGTDPSKIVAIGGTQNDNLAIVARFKVTGGTNPDERVGVGVHTLNSTNPSPQGYNYVLHNFTALNEASFLNDGTGWYVLPYSWTKNTNYIMEVFYTGTNTRGRINYGTWNSQAMSGRTGYAALNIGSFDATSVWDWAFIRKCITTEPSHSTWGIQEVEPTTPLIALSSPSQVAPGNIYQGLTNAHLSRFQASVTNANATLNSLTFTSAGTATTSDLVNFKLYYNTSGTFPGGSPLSSMTETGAGVHTFSGLTQAISSGTTGYFWITCEVNATATTGRTVNIAASPTLTFAAGTPTGTITVGGTQTIISGPGSTVTTTYSTAGTYSWTAPSCVTRITVEAWGGGGAGGPATRDYNNAASAGGGAGGSYAKKTDISVTLGTPYAVVVGATSISSPTTVINGNPSTFGSTIVVAAGGAGGAVSSGATSNGGIGSTNGCTGDAGSVFAGGNGGNGTNNSVSGGGGGGAGSTGTGNSASGGTAGSAKTEFGGAGGAGVNTQDTRNAGSVYGGGGSGGRRAPAWNTNNYAGGNGAPGLVRISYTLPLNPTITLGNNPTICQGITTASLSYNAPSGCPDKYSVNYDAASFTDITDAELGALISLTGIPAGASAGIYTGTLTVKNSFYGFVSTSYPITITITAPGTWLGLSSDWHASTNWSCGTVPTSTMDVTIPSSVSFFPTISSSASCNNIELKSGASLIDQGSFLSVTNKSTMFREISDIRWHFLSSPVEGQKIWPAFAPTPTGNPLAFAGVEPWPWDFYYYNPNCPLPGKEWVNLRNNDGTYNSGDIDEGSNFAGFGPSIPTMTVAKGYLVAYASGSSTHAFEVSPPYTFNTGDIGITNFPNSVNVYNLIGNPYPSSLDWMNSTWDRTNLEKSGEGYDYWIMNDGVGLISGNYVIFNSVGTGSTTASKDIAPGQAFWVKAKATGTLNLTIPNAARTHSTQAWLKNSNSESNLIRLHLKTSGNTYSDEMIVDINPAYSGNEGSDKLWSFYAEAPEIYAIKGGNNYTIDRYKDLNTNLTVNVGTKTGIAADYTITATNIQDFTLSSKVLLEDLKTGIITDLKQTPAYTFAGAPGDDADRFRLIIGSPIGIDEPNTTGSFNIYTYENMVYVQNDKSNEAYFVTVSNMLGQTMVRSNFTGNSLNRIEMQNVPGVYVVNVVSNGKTYSQKVVIR